ncbi:MAG: UDP-2,4-diacetamido-2,4,6-trideoxy-beta-L-altropyranose hydrolase [Epsilonproteobacteria bacterium]|nr:UDP-2,4-diacetamido-2,4,6-trideoxy-beta-L-altropyranose hydrolase [Campylobacterota bacterium]
MNILIRADASSNIGTGHVMRDLVLAKQFENAQVIFATQNLAGNINQKIVDDGYQIINLQSNCKDELLEHIKKLAIDLLIIDHYAIDATYEYDVRQRSGVKILSFDDTYEKHYCDYLLNQNIYAKRSAYTKLVPDFCTLFCGLDFALLRDEFHQCHKHPKVLKKEITVLLSLGGSDVKNISAFVIDAIKDLENIKIQVVLGASNPHVARLQREFAHIQNIELIVNTNSMAALMAQADIGIIAAGSSTIEGLFMHLPMITIQSAENQSLIVKALSEKNLAINLGKAENLSLKMIQEALYHIMTPKVYRGLSHHTYQIATKNISDFINLRQVNKEDIDFLYLLANDKRARQNSLNQKEISYEEHTEWFGHKLNAIKEKESEIYIYEEDKQKIGVIRIDKHGIFYVVSITVLDAYRGLGMAKRMLRALLYRVRERILIAYIKHSNETSKRLFLSVGFQEARKCKDISLYRLKIK